MTPIAQIPVRPTSLWQPARVATCGELSYRIGAGSVLCGREKGHAGLHIDFMRFPAIGFSVV